MKYSTIALATCFLISCNSRTSKEHNNTPRSFESSEEYNIPVKDTTIFLDGITTSGYHGQDLTESMAKNILYTHFQERGFYTEYAKPSFEKFRDVDNYIPCAEYARIFFVDLNGNKKRDAVISYWFDPAYTNGHCVQPHYAIIADTDKGYQVTDKEFIPPSFILDSIAVNRQQVVIHCKEYECANKRVLRNLVLKLKSGQEKGD